ncbi:hypothetical protein B484DRAFT_449058 [Ochromonadaceae sp. CCMP2298]|nr:hypothetical protein B484DRAFT_449058 [Ochromonadaceae sp. CCMP2298]
MGPLLRPVLHQVLRRRSGHAGERLSPLDQHRRRVRKCPGLSAGEHHIPQDDHEAWRDRDYGLAVHVSQGLLLRRIRNKLAQLGDGSGSDGRGCCAAALVRLGATVSLPHPPPTYSRLLSPPPTTSRSFRLLVSGVPLVDVCGASKGKGFQGVMERWQERRMHGNSLAPRHGQHGQLPAPRAHVQGQEYAREDGRPRDSGMHGGGGG